LLALVRNEEVDDMVASMVDLERTWNNKFNYPWTFFNDQPFSEEFKKKTSAATNAKCNYGTLLAFWVLRHHETISTAN
jgi:mannosyltransferase